MNDDPSGEAPRDSSSMQRVKLYRLTPDGLWQEKGTGSVSVEYMEQSGAVGLVIIAENDTRTLLIHRISFDDIYQRQGEDTIITWMDVELETDIALSFQEEDGCNVIWDQVQEVQKRGREALPKADVLEEASEGPLPPPPSDDDTLEAMIGPHPDPDGMIGEGRGPGSVGYVELPPPEPRHLSHIASVLQDMNPFNRDRLAEQALSPGYLRRLLDIFHDLEDLDDTAGLHCMYSAVRGLIMLNDTMLLETMVNEDNVMDVVGALEYDPEQTARQQHREFLRDKVLFREVVPITDPSVRAKIHQTYRVGYLKDVILPRVLDDGTFATLSSLMMFNNVEVLVALTHSASFFPDLFRRLNNTKLGAAADAEWVEHVSFLQELCGMAKHLQIGNRTQMLDKLSGLGLYRVMAAALERPNDSLRLRAMDVLLAAAQHDPAPLRAFIEASPQQGRLMSLLIKALSHVSEGGLQEQALELLRVLLNIDAMDNPTQSNSFLELFYATHMVRIMDALNAGGGADVEKGGAPAPTMVVVIELMCFCVARHGVRVKYYLLRNLCVEAVLKLLNRREQWLAAAAVRFLRICIGLKDEFYNRYILRNNLFEPVVTAFLANGNRYNLFNSTVLEMMDFIRIENVKSVVQHLVENFGDRLAEVDYVDTFSALRLKYEQAQDRSGCSGGDETSAAQAALEQQRKRLDARAPTKDEEDYFGEGGDDNDEGPPTPAPSPSISTGGPPPPPPRPPPLAGLVDYGDEDDENDNNDDEGNAASPSWQHSPSRSTHSTASLASSGSGKRGSQHQLRRRDDEGSDFKRLRGSDHGRRHPPEPLQGGSSPCLDSPPRDRAARDTNSCAAPGRVTLKAGSHGAAEASPLRGESEGAPDGHHSAAYPRRHSIAVGNRDSEAAAATASPLEGGKPSVSGGRQDPLSPLPPTSRNNSSSSSSSGSDSDSSLQRQWRRGWTKGEKAHSRVGRGEGDPATPANNGRTQGSGFVSRASLPTAAEGPCNSDTLPQKQQKQQLSLGSSSSNGSKGKHQHPSLDDNHLNTTSRAWVPVTSASPSDSHRSTSPMVAPEIGGNHGRHGSSTSAAKHLGGGPVSDAANLSRLQQGPPTNGGFRGGPSSKDASPLQFQLPSQPRGTSFRRSLAGRHPPTPPDSPRLSSRSG